MRLLLLLTGLFFVTNVFSQLGTFNSELLEKKILRKTIKLPYLEKNNYYGYINPNKSPDEIRGGKSYFYLYVWIPIAIPEIGIRMVSPIPSKMNPKKGDFISETFKLNSSERVKYFDTWISLDKASNVISKEAAVNDFDSHIWNQISYNDDSSELPSQPSGNKYNSLLRKVSNVNDPLNSLTVGLYRIGFTTYKRGIVEGSFIAQIGTTINIPGVMIVEDINDLIN